MLEKGYRTCRVVHESLELRSSCRGCCSRHLGYTKCVWGVVLVVGRGGPVGRGGGDGTDTDGGGVGRFGGGVAKRPRPLDEALRLPVTGLARSRHRA